MRSGFVQVITLLLLVGLVLTTGFLFIKNQNYKRELASQNSEIDQLKEQIDALRGYRADSREPSPLSAADLDFSLKSEPDLSLTANWEIYRNTDFGFEVKTPPSWDIPYTGGDLFPQGNLKIFQAEKSTEKATFAIGNPIKTTDDVLTWYKKTYPWITNAEDDLTSKTINGQEFQAKYGSSRLCATYYFTKKGGYVFEFFLSTWCNKEAVDQYDQTLVNVINTLKFTN